MARVEFIALMAMMFATIAFSIDAMLPGLPQIARELTPEDLTRAPLILTTFVLGMGLGTFFAGPLSDALGRRRVIYMGACLYTTAAFVAWISQSFEVVLAARFIQGIGASGPRVVCIAVIRDIFSGREMARILSIVMMIFTLVPAIAPAMGALIIEFSGWRAIFLAFIAFSLTSMIWMSLRLPETLPEADRRPLRLPLMFAAVREMLMHPVVRLSIAVQSLSMSMLFATLMMVQPIYEQVYDKAASFPYWFGGLALLSATANILNALLVMRLGMRRLVTYALCAQVIFSGGMVFGQGFVDVEMFAVFAVWQAFMFFQVGLTIGNLNAIAMEPMGHIAGMAASVIGAISTVVAAAIASPIGLLFDGTIWPLVGSVFILSTVGASLMLYMGRIESRQPA